ERRVNVAGVVREYEDRPPQLGQGLRPVQANAIAQRQEQAEKPPDEVTERLHAEPLRARRARSVSVLNPSPDPLPDTERGRKPALLPLSVSGRGPGGGVEHRHSGDRPSGLPGSRGHPFFQVRRSRSQLPEETLVAGVAGDLPGKVLTGTT